MRARWWLGATMLAFGLACMGGDDGGDDAPSEVVSPDDDDGARQGRDGRGARGRNGRGGGGSGGDTPAAEPDPEPAPVGGGSGNGSPTAPSGNTDLGNRTWQVERRLISRWEKDPSSLADASQKGQGWELKRVKKGDAQFLGMLNGDVLMSANGYELGSTTQLAIAYAALGDAKKLTVKFKREGAMKTHTYKIVD
jgi:hypothetical protein